MDIFIPGLITVSEANSREHWRKAHARRKNQKHMLVISLFVSQVPRDLPVTITLIRVSSRFLDDDNLQSAFKYIRDAIADYFIPGLLPGRADSDPRINWKYSQEKSKEKGTRIQFSWQDPSILQACAAPITLDQLKTGTC